MLAFVPRCLLRLLAFPGTNVRVYGEVEREFGKYCGRMLEGAAGAAEDFAKSVRAAAAAAGPARAGGGAGGIAAACNDGWEAADVPATRRRARAYRDRVLGTFREVLHCLLEEGGRGGGGGGGGGEEGGTGAGRGEEGGGNAFYRLGCDPAARCKDACARNLCCGAATHSGDLGDPAHRRSSSRDVEGPPGNGVAPRTTAATATTAAAAATPAATTQYGNNPLVGDVGDMSNLSPRARTDGRELYELLGAVLRDLDALDACSVGPVPGTAADRAARVLDRVAELRALASRIAAATPSPDDDGGAPTDDVDAEAVRHRLEEGGSAAAAGSAADTVRAAATAVRNMVDPPPHDSIFGLDVLRGCFLARYRGARQLWVDRVGGGGGRLDVVRVPSEAALGSRDNDTGSPTATAASLLPLSPRKGRGDVDLPRRECVPPSPSPLKREGKERRRKAVLYCNPNAGLVEVATGMGLTGGNVAEEEEGDGNEDKEP